MKDRRLPWIILLLPAAVLGRGVLGSWGRHGVPFRRMSAMASPAVNLRGAQLAALNLAGADLRYSCPASARLQSVRYDSRTQWPVSFDPERHGAILMHIRAEGAAQ